MYREQDDVKLPLRQIVLSLATGCLLAMTSGLVLCLHLHLAHNHDPFHHDHEHCSLCQQLLVAMKDFAAHTEPTHVQIDQIGQPFEVCLDATQPQTTALSLGARAPPA